MTYPILARTVMLILLFSTSSARASPVRFTLHWWFAKDFSQKNFIHTSADSAAKLGIPELGGCSNTINDAAHNGNDEYAYARAHGSFFDGDYVFVIGPCNADVDTASLSEWREVEKALDEYYRGDDSVYQNGRVWEKLSYPAAPDSIQYGLLKVFTRVWHLSLQRRNQLKADQEYKLAKERITEKATKNASSEKAAWALKKQDVATIQGVISEYQSLAESALDNDKALLEEFKTYRDSFETVRQRLVAIVTEINARPPAKRMADFDEILAKKKELAQIFLDDRTLGAKLGSEAQTARRYLQGIDENFLKKISRYENITAQYHIDPNHLTTETMIAALGKIADYTAMRKAALEKGTDELIEKIDLTIKRIMDDVARGETEAKTQDAVALLSSADFLAEVYRKTNDLYVTPQKGTFSSLMYLSEHYAKMKAIVALSLHCEGDDIPSYMKTGCMHLAMNKSQAQAFLNKAPLILRSNIKLINAVKKGFIDASFTANILELCDRGLVADAMERYDSLLTQMDRGEIK